MRDARRGARLLPLTRMSPFRHYCHYADAATALMMPPLTPPPPIAAIASAAICH
jgi:hypothetical protein